MFGKKPDKSFSLLAVFAFVAILSNLFSASAFGGPGPYISTSPQNWRDFRGDSFSSRNDKILGAFFFYWYDVYTGSNLVTAYGDDLTSHPDYDYHLPIPFSFMDVGWWAREISRMSHCGIDLVLPDYWGRGAVSDDWSNLGLDHLNAALDTLDGQGASNHPKVAMFYDTTTLEGVDLNTPRGKDQLYGSIRDFYSRIRPDRWGRFDRKAVVVLYRMGGIVNINGDAFREADRRFANDFGGVHLYFIGHPNFANYGVPISKTFEWGAEVPQHNGVRIDHDVAVISPGSRHYNAHHTGSYGQDKLSRNAGNTYRNAWNVVLDSHKNIVFIETWNEFHESSGVSPTVEFGHRELDTTRHYSIIFHNH